MGPQMFQVAWGFVLRVSRRKLGAVAAVVLATRRP